MATTNIRFLHQETSISGITNIQNTQSFILNENDTDLGIRLAGYKDGAGNAYRLLVKDQDAKVNDMYLTDVDHGGTNLARIVHSGDTNTYIEFQSDQIKLTNGGTDAATIDTTEFKFGRQININGQQFHAGAGNSLAMYLGDDAGARGFNYKNLSGTTVANISSLGYMYSPRFIFSVSDTDTYLDRIGANNVGLYCGATKIWDATSSTFEITQELKIKVYEQAAEPTISANDYMAIWVDTDDNSRVYLVFCRTSSTTDQVKIELTANGGVAIGNNSWTKIEPSTITLDAGTSTESVTDLQDANDGNIYHIDEAAATPGIDLKVDFTGVTSFAFVNVIARYVGLDTHSVSIQLYDWQNTAWDTYDSILTDGATMCDHSFWIPDDTNYIGTGGDAGKVRVRFNHTEGGNASHDAYIDVVALYT